MGNLWDHLITAKKSTVLDLYFHLRIDFYDRSMQITNISFAQNLHISNIWISIILNFPWLPSIFSMMGDSRLSIDKFKILDNTGFQDFECGHLGFFARTGVNPGSWVKVELEIVWKTNSSVSPSKISHFTVDRCIRYFEIRFILDFQ